MMRTAMSTIIFAPAPAAVATHFRCVAHNVILAWDAYEAHTQEAHEGKHPCVLTLHEVSA